MRNIILLALAIFSLQLGAQTSMQQLRDISKKLSVETSANPFNPANLAGTITHKLDSIVTSDAGGVILAKLEMEYNSEGQTTVMRQYEKDSLTTNLILTSVTTLEYDNEPNPTHVTIEALNPETQQLETQLEYVVFYDASDRVDSLVLSLADPISGEFGELLAIKNVYNGDLLDLSRQWFNLSGFWIPFSQTDYIYNQDLLVEVLTSFLNFETFEMELSSRTTITYDANDRRKTVTSYYWEDPNWVAESQTLFEYYPNGTLKSEIAQVFLFDEWVNETWNQYHQDVVNDEFDATYYYWSNDAWQKSDSAHHILNPSLPWSDVAAPTELSILQDVDLFSTSFFDLNESSIDESQFFTYDSLSGDLVFSYRDTYYYSLFDPSGIETILPEYLKVSPNPATTNIVIDLDAEANGKYTVTSISGQRVALGILDHGKTVINTANWVGGIYLILFELQDGSKYVHKQIID
jgi:hypothetical protein